MNKKKKWILGLFTLIVLVACLGIHFIAPYGILKPPISTSIKTPLDYGLKGDSIIVESIDNAMLAGYWIKSNIDTTFGIMILVHGVGGHKESFLGLAKHLADLGIESVLFDGRAHGKSTGRFCTYGHLEKQDVSKIIDTIKSKQANLKIGIWGCSLGGAIAIQSLEFDQRIAFGIIESTFTDFRQIVFDYKNRILKGFGLRFISDYVVDRVGKIADFNPDRIKPIQSVENITQPVLIAHGNSDDNISVEYGKALFAHLNSKEKELIIVEGGEHIGLFDTGGIEYQEKLMQFIAQRFDFKLPLKR